MPSLHRVRRIVQRACHGAGHRLRIILRNDLTEAAAEQNFVGACKSGGDDRQPMRQCLDEHIAEGF